ncbi:UPF0481 protein At3g47200-like [Magnolia sinica]|uniref:UPF0481 protein At3g47200-like n=1 Tax=Magnolia sinica TaxID=86752 RepID=UPI00265B5EE5|nr:UPF0481 protein At3g47200-like [Magnolia sinica]
MPEIEEEANKSTNASRRPSCLTPGRQALADSMMISVTAFVSKLRRGDPPTIYIVPQRIQQVNKVAYEPQMVSIGPYHHGNKSLQGMEENKWLYLHSFLSGKPNHRLEDYLKAMEELEDKAGSCYSDNIGSQVGNEFVKMMVLDACFIVEIFLMFHPIEQWEELKQNEEDLGLLSAMDQEFFFHSNRFEDQVLHTKRKVDLIGYDMLLLENQIPFFVLQRIFITACPVNVPDLLEKMALHFFHRFMPMNKKIELEDRYYHLLHLFRSHFIPTPTDHGKEHNLLCNPIIKYVLNKLKNLLIFLPSSKETSLPITEPPKMIPCATDLDLAGVKFKKNEESNSILNVKFSHGVLEIPLLSIDDGSETLFRNLVAFEQCWPNATDHFTTYFWFMDCLVNTSNDVALLHHNEIIDHRLGSDEDVAQLFNRLCTGIFHDPEESYLWDLHQNVQKHCKNKWNRWRAILKRDYFTNPWSFISLIAASILLLLTITQTFFTIFPYYRPRS